MTTVGIQSLRPLKNALPGALSLCRPKPEYSATFEKFRFRVPIVIPVAVGIRCF